MRKTLQLFLFTLSLLTTFLAYAAKAQVYTASNYYYNNFDGGQLGSVFTAIGGNSLEVSPTNLATGNGYALSSTGTSVAGGYSFSLITNGTDLNTNLGYEWTMIYRNNGADTDNATTIANNKNSWRYWLIANTADLNTAQGYYLTQNGNKIEIWLSSGQSAVLSVDLPVGNNTTYAIRVQRMNLNGQTFRLFIDEYSAAKKEATTLRGSGSATAHNMYNHSGLQVSSTSAGRFKFDEIKLYSRKLEIAGANDPINGFSSPLYNGQKDAVIYALKFKTRGLFREIIRIVTGTQQATGGFGDFVENPRLFRSTDNYLGNADDVLIDKTQSGANFTPTVGYYELVADNFQTQIFSSVGTAEGLLIDAGALFFKVDIKVGASAKGNFNINGLTFIGNNPNNINYASPTSQNVVDVNTTATTAAPVYSAKDWLGGTTDWNTASNWNPAGVPMENDLVRIGVEMFTSQPTLTVNKTVGNIIFGTIKAPNLTVATGFSLTVRGNVENQGAVNLSGAGALTVNGRYLLQPTSAGKIVTSTIGQLNVANLVLNAQGVNATFNANGGNTTISNALQTLGTNSATFLLGNGATLTLTGAKPFSLAATNNAVTFNAMSTVAYSAAVPQTVKAGLTYNNLNFSGAGTKIAEAGTLTVSGNWNSSGGKIDLLSNESEVSFTGVTQSITDLGSDSGNGVVFKNVKFSGGGTKSLSDTGKFAVGVGGYLTMEANTILQTSGSLTLQAGDLGTASVKAIPSDASIRGEVTVERYIKGGSKDMWRTYRMLGSPVYDNTTSFINTNTVGNRTYSFEQFIDDIIISGTGGSANGFDQTDFNQAGAWTYNNGYLAIPSINTSVNIGRGAYLFYRGNRSDFNNKIKSPFVNPESIVMTFKGNLNQQDITVPLTHGSTGFSLVSNPYAATIDWNIVSKTASVANVVWVWNPSKRQYAVFNGTDSVNGGSRYIPAGQSFFVQTSNTTSPSITFTESAKYTPASGIKQAPVMQLVQEGLQLNGKSMMATTQAVSVTEPARIRVKLQKDGTENSDETLIVLKEEGRSEFAGDDVLRMGGEVVFLSSRSSDNKELAINYMPNISDISSVSLSINTSTNGDYSLNFALSDIPLGYEVKLKDNYLHTVTTVNTSDTSYPLTINRSIPASLGANRFEIMLSPQTTLPVILTAFNANKTNAGVLVNWGTSTATNHNHFVVQRAGDDLVYTDLGSTPANKEGIYAFLDRAPLIGHNYYRLLQVDKDGKRIANDPIVVSFDLNTAITDGIFVYPTIIKASFTVKYNGSLSNDRYLIKITDVNGTSILRQEVGKSVLLNGYNGELSAIAPSVYFVTLIDLSTGRNLGVTKIMKQ